MRELKCPQCGNVFSVDEADYAAIVSQVKTQEFDAEVRLRLAEIQKQAEIKQEAESIRLSQQFQGKLNAIKICIFLREMADKLEFAMVEQFFFHAKILIANY